MRKFLVLVVALAAVVAACGGAAPTTSDPYELVRKSQAATWDKVQVEVGVTVSGEDAISIDPSAMRFAVDSKAGKANVHIALPIAALGEEAATQLTALGIIGPNLELDVIFDGEALYAKSPLGSFLSLMLIQSGETPPANPTGWLQLLSKADIESLGALVGGGAGIPDDLPIPSAADAATIKSTLEEMGITLTHAGTAKRGNVDAEHVTAAVDVAKLVESDYFKNMGSSKPDIDADDATLTGDLWFDTGNSRLIGIDIHAVSKTDANEKADITINLRDPDAGVTFDKPADAEVVPLMEMLGSLMEAFGGGLIPQ